MGMKTTRNIAFIAFLTAIMCVIAPISIPMVPVPITLATLAVYLIGGLLDYKRATIPVIAYILIGIIGVPVFSKYSAGPVIFAGPTGGFILGYIIGVFAQALLTTWKKDKFYIYPLAMILGTVFIYGFGLVWFMFYMNTANKEVTLASALMACVVPFLIGDAIKITVASVVSYRLRKYADKALMVSVRSTESMQESK